MSEVIARIEQTREMLLAALAERNWEAVGSWTWNAACASVTWSVRRRAMRPMSVPALSSCWPYTVN